MNIHEAIPDGKLTEKLRTLLDQLDRWEPHVNKALASAHYSHTFDDVVRMVLLNQAHYYELDNCCIFMIVDVYPQHSVYHCFIACGDMQGIIDAEPLIRANAEALGCAYMSISGRIGWPRVLHQHGWEHKLSTLYKKV